MGWRAVGRERDGTSEQSEDDDTDNARQSVLNEV